MSLATSEHGDYDGELDIEYWEKEMEHLVTEDDTPLDNRFSERQQRLLPAILFASWPGGKPFEALSNVGLFYSLYDEPPVVPDFMLSLGVKPRPLSSKKADKSYMVWVYGKTPELVVEIVSKKKGGELDRKMEIYAKVRIAYYAVYDPFFMLGTRELRLFKLEGGQYVELISAGYVPEIGLGLAVWEGTIDDNEARWLRFIDKDGKLLPTPEENALREKQRADEAKQQADEAKQTVEQEKKQKELAEKRAELLAQRLRALGEDPDSIELLSS